GLRALQPAQRGVAVGNDGSQRLIDLMGDGGDQFPHRGQPRNARKVGLGLGQRILGALLGTEILDDDGDSRPFAVDDRARRSADLGAEIAARAPRIALLQLVTTALPFEQAVNVLARAGSLRSFAYVDQRDVENLLRTVAKHLL